MLDAWAAHSKKSSNTKARKAVRKPAAIQNADHNPSLAWQAAHGLPKLGDIVIIRGCTAIYPMWAGKVIDVVSTEEMDCDAPFCAEYSKPSMPISTDEPSWFVQWFDFKDDATSQDIQPLNNANWDVYMQTQGAAQFDQWKHAKRSFAQGNFSPLPKAAVDRWKEIVFLPSDLQSYVSRSQLIVWGPSVNNIVLTQGGKIQSHMFGAVIDDLCEISPCSAKEAT